MDDKKKTGAGWLVAAGVAVVGIVSAVSANTSSIVPVEAPIPAPIVQQAAAENQKPSETKPELDSKSDLRTSGLSNDNYYTNVDGNTVHSPAYSESSCEAVGASAECRDGTCSFSQNRRGTCSHHGGVAEWL